MGNRSDDFNRADSTLSIGSPSDGGGAYTVNNSWGISTNRAYKLATANTWEFAVLDAASAVVDVSVTIQTIGRGGPAARYADLNNAIFVAVEATQTQMYKRVSSTFTQLGSTYTNTAVAGDVWTLRVTSANAISALKNDVLRIGPVTDAAGSANTKHGMAVYNIATRLDSLSIVDTAAGGTAVGLASETDTALSLPGTQILAIGLATEADTALALAARQLAAAGLATETGMALARLATQIRAVGLAAETDTALALSPSAANAVGLAAEVDTALAPPLVSRRAAGLSIETDQALALTPGVANAAGLAVETDTALQLVGRQARVVGRAQEADAALALGTAQVGLVGLALEIDASFALAGLQRLTIGRADETDSALSPGAAVASLQPLAGYIATAAGRQWNAEAARRWLAQHTTRNP